MKTNLKGQSAAESSKFNSLYTHFGVLFLSLFLWSSVGWGQIALRGTPTTASITGSTALTTITLNKPTGVISGDVMIVAITNYTNSNTTFTSASLAGWTLIDGRSLNTTSQKSYGTILYKIAGATEPTSYSFSIAGSKYAAATITAFSGVDINGGTGFNGTGTGPFDATIGTINRGTSTLTATAISTTNTNSAVIMYGFVGLWDYTYSGWAATSPSSLTEIAEVVSGGNYASVGAAWATKPTSGSTGSGSVTMSGTSGYSGGILIALKQPSCSGTPTAGTVSPSSQNICSGSTPGNISLSGFSSSGGISFQWQESTDNTNWVNVSTGTGATTSTYTPASFAGSTIYYRCNVTCTNSSLSDASTVATVDPPINPTTQVSNLTFSNLTYTGFTASWTNGNGNRRVVYLSNSAIVDPTNATGAAGLSASTIYSGSGQQIVYDGTGTTVTVSNLSISTTYYVKVIEYTRCGSSTYDYYYNVSSSTNNSSTTTLSPTAPPWTEAFTTTTTPSSWNISGWTIGSARGVTGNPGNNIYINLYSSVTSGSFNSGIIGPIVSGMKLYLDYKHSNFSSTSSAPGSGTGSFKVQISSNNGSTYTDLATVSNDASTSWRSLNYDLSSYANSNVIIKIAATWVSGDWDYGFDNFRIQQPPTITTSGTLSTFNSYGAASSSQSFSVSGSNLMSDITITAPTGFQVSTNSSSGFASTVTLTQSSGTVSSQNIYVRMAALSSSPSSSNITCTSTNATTQNVLVSGIVTNQWSGVTSTAWSTTSNWSCNALPISTQNVEIPSSGITNYPVLSGAVTIKDLNIGSGTLSLNGQTLTINGAVTGSGTISGSATSSLVIGANAGTLNFTSGSNTLKNLTLNASATTTLGNALEIATGATPGVLTVNTGATLTTGGFLTLKSDATGTARVDNSAGTISGEVSVERYIPQNTNRAWRALAVPTYSSSQSIANSWQLGTLITGPGGANGLDQSTGGYSMMTYDASTDALVGVGNTATIISNSTTSPAAYFLYVRGDRTTGVANTNLNPSATTLSTKGTLYQGTITTSISATNSGGTTYHLVGNPYVSPINLNSFNAANTGAIDNVFYLWDPKITSTTDGVGAVATFTASGSTYIPAVTGGSYSGAITEIPSGMAFFVKKSASSSGSVVFNESMKSSGSTISNGYNGLKTTAAVDGLLQVNLNVKINDSTERPADGILAIFDANEHMQVDAADAQKMGNFGENMSIRNQTDLLAIEKRPLLNLDTLHIHTTGLSNRAYRLQFNPSQFNSSAKAFLVDHYSNTIQAISLQNRSEYPFNIDANAQSKGPNRFDIIFEQSALQIASSKKLNAIELYPNPVKDGFINLSMHQQREGAYEASIMNALGAEILKVKWIHNNGNPIQTLDVSSLASGLYYIKVSNEFGDQSMHKFIQSSSNF